VFNSGKKYSSIKRIYYKKKYSDKQKVFKTETVMSKGSFYSMGSTNPERTDVELSVNKKTNSLGSTNPDHAVVEFFDKEKF